MTFKIVFLLLALVGVSNSATFLTFGGKGFITQNKEYYLPSDSGYINSTLNAETSSVTFRFINDSTYSFWSVTFRSPVGQSLSPGLEYLGAARFQFENNGGPTLDISGDGRGSNQVSGSFKVLELTWTPKGHVATAAVDFVHFNEKLSSQWTMGSLRYNSNIPAGAIPEPSSFILAFIGLGLVARRKR